MQVSLDFFIKNEENQVERTQEEPVQKEDGQSEVYKRAEEATRNKFYEWFGVRDNACCEHGKINFKLHAGALWLYRDASGNFKALGDIDHVYHICESGLMENIRALKKIFRLLEERLGLKVFAVGKDYDDVLHIHILNINEKTNVRLVEKEFEEMGLQAYVTPLENTDLDEYVESFENHLSYMPAVGPDVLQRALDESGKQEVEGTVQGGKKADVAVSEDPCTEIAMQRYGVRSGEVCCRYGKVNTRLHLGALILYKDGYGSFKALADIDHLYHECVKGLIDNIRAFKTIFDHFSSKGMNIYAVSKCFDDCIHVSILGDKGHSEYHTIDNGPPGIRGLKVDIGTFVGSIAEAVKNLEKHSWYMQAVTPDVLQKGLNVGEVGTAREWEKTDVAESESVALTIAKDRYGVKSGKVCCPYGEPNLRFHTGSVSLYWDEAGGLKVLADMPRAYSKCEQGLIENIRVLKRVYDYFLSKGFRVYAIQKSFDDGIFVYAIGKRRKGAGGLITLTDAPPEIRGVDVALTLTEKVDATVMIDIELFPNHIVSDDVVQKALMGYIRGEERVSHEAPTVHG
jgi:hypothetical protein